MKKISVPEIVARKQNGEKITVLTAYDYTLARILDACGIDMILVGDSVGPIVSGYDNTLPVSMDA